MILRPQRRSLRSLQWPESRLGRAAAVANRHCLAPVQEQHSQFFNAQSSLQTEVNGQLRQGNNFMIDGTDENERTDLVALLPNGQPATFQ